VKLIRSTMRTTDAAVRAPLVSGMLAAIVLLAGAPARSATSEALTFREAVDLAWSRLPDRRTFAANKAVAEARYRSGSAWFPNAPNMTGTFDNDKIAGSNENYITNQVLLATPVWLPGEGSATQRQAAADSAANDEAATAAHLAVARQVLDAALEATIAGGARDVAEKRRAAAHALYLDAVQRTQTGEAAEADMLAAQAEDALADAALRQAEARYAAALVPLSLLTGSDAVPRLDLPVAARPDVAEERILARHPQMAAAEAAVVSAREGERLTRIQDRDDPELGVQMTDDKQPGTRWDTRVGVVVRFSFATEARNAPRRAAAEADTTRAEVQLDRTRRGVLAELREARVMLQGAEDAASAASSAAAAQRKRLSMVQHAWRLGEAPLIELVRANGAAFDAQLEQVRSRTTLSAARLQLVLAEGDIP
jgi:cobalt-zinc-cadmium efflux system outer membrane protein